MPHTHRQSSDHAHHVQVSAVLTAAAVGLANSQADCQFVCSMQTALFSKSCVLRRASTHA